MFKKQQLELKYYNELNMPVYSVKRTILNGMYVDTVTFSNEVFRIDTFLVKNGEWKRIMNSAELPYFSAKILLEGYSINSFSSDGRDKYRYELKNADGEYSGFSVYEMNWYHNTKFGENFLGTIKFNEFLGPLHFKYNDHSEVRLRIINFKD